MAAEASLSAYAKLKAEDLAITLVDRVISVLSIIVLGSIALKRGRTQGVRVAAFAAALALFAYIVSVAITKSRASRPCFLR